MVLGIASNLLLLLIFTHICFPGARWQTRKFLELSYGDPESGVYIRGRDDVFFVLCWIIAFTALRAVMIDFVFVPFARFKGVKKAKNRTRFAEQTWLLVYYTTFWTLGMVRKIS